MFGEVATGNGKKSNPSWNFGGKNGIYEELDLFRKVV